MVKPFMAKELIDGILFHSDLASLHNHVDRFALPEELGGTAGTFADATCIDTIEQIGPLLEEFKSLTLTK